MRRKHRDIDKYCSTFYCERMKKYLCCEDCERKDWCIDRCFNDPKVCGLYQKQNPEELENEVRE